MKRGRKKKAVVLPIKNSKNLAFEYTIERTVGGADKVRDLESSLTASRELVTAQERKIKQLEELLLYNVKNYERSKQALQKLAEVF